MALIEIDERKVNESYTKDKRKVVCRNYVLEIDAISCQKRKKEEDLDVTESNKIAEE